MIRQVFAGCTVFAIGAFPSPSVCALRYAEPASVFAAHRLGTIIDYDRIVVLENAKMVEFGAHPAAHTHSMDEEPARVSILCVWSQARRASCWRTATTAPSPS